MPTGERFGVQSLRGKPLGKKPPPDANVRVRGPVPKGTQASVAQQEATHPTQGMLKVNRALGAGTPGATEFAPKGGRTAVPGGVQKQLAAEQGITPAQARANLRYEKAATKPDLTGVPGFAKRGIAAKGDAAALASHYLVMASAGQSIADYVPKLSEAFRTLGRDSTAQLASQFPNASIYSPEQRAAAVSKHNLPPYATDVDLLNAEVNPGPKLLGSRFLGDVARNAPSSVASVAAGIPLGIYAVGHAGYEAGQGHYEQSKHELGALARGVAQPYLHPIQTLRTQPAAEVLALLGGVKGAGRVAGDIAKLPAEGTAVRTLPVREEVMRPVHERGVGPVEPGRPVAAGGRPTPPPRGAPRTPQEAAAMDRALGAGRSTSVTRPTTVHMTPAQIEQAISRTHESIARAARTRPQRQIGPGEAPRPAEKAAPTPEQAAGMHIATEAETAAQAAAAARAHEPGPTQEAMQFGDTANRGQIAFEEKAAPPKGAAGEKATLGASGRASMGVEGASRAKGIRQAASDAIALMNAREKALPTPTNGDILGFAQRYLEAKAVRRGERPRTYMQAVRTARADFLAHAEGRIPPEAIDAVIKGRGWTPAQETSLRAALGEQQVAEPLAPLGPAPPVEHVNAILDLVHNVAKATGQAHFHELVDVATRAVREQQLMAPSSWSHLLRKGDTATAKDVEMAIRRPAKPLGVRAQDRAWSALHSRQQPAGRTEFMHLTGEHPDLFHETNLPENLTAEIPAWDQPGTAFTRRSVAGAPRGIEESGAYLRAQRRGARGGGQLGPRGVPYTSGRVTGGEPRTAIGAGGGGLPPENLGGPPGAAPSEGFYRGGQELVKRPTWTRAGTPEVSPLERPARAEPLQMEPAPQPTPAIGYYSHNLVDRAAQALSDWYAQSDVAGGARWHARLRGKESRGTQHREQIAGDVELRNITHPVAEALSRFSRPEQEAIAFAHSIYKEPADMTVFYENRLVDAKAQAPLEGVGKNVRAAHSELVRNLTAQVETWKRIEKKTGKTDQDRLAAAADQLREASFKSASKKLTMEDRPGKKLYTEYGMARRAWLDRAFMDEQQAPEAMQGAARSWLETDNRYTDLLQHVRTGEDHPAYLQELEQARQDAEAALRGYRSSVLGFDTPELLSRVDPAYVPRAEKLSTQLKRTFIPGRRSVATTNVLYRTKMGGTLKHYSGHRFLSGAYDIAPEHVLAEMARPYGVARAVSHTMSQVAKFGYRAETGMTYDPTRFVRLELRGAGTKPHPYLSDRTTEELNRVAAETNTPGAAFNEFWAHFKDDASQGPMGRIVNAGQHVEVPPGEQYLVPREVYDNLRNQFDQRSFNDSPGLRELVMSTRFWRAAVLYARPAWLVANIAGNTLQGMLGGVGPVDWARAGRSKYREQMPLNAEFQGFAAHAFPRMGEAGVSGRMTFGVGAGLRNLAHQFADAPNPLAHPLRASSHLMKSTLSTGRALLQLTGEANVAFENRMRRALYLHEAVPRARAAAISKGFNATNEAILGELAKAKSMEEAIPFVVSHVDRFLGNFQVGKRSPNLDLAIPFHRWYRFITRLMLVNLPWHYPGRALLLNRLGAIGATTQASLGPVPAYMGGAIPAGNGAVSTQALNPFGTLYQLAGQEGGAGGTMGIGWRGLLQTFNPVAQTLAGAATGVNPITGQDITGPTGLPTKGRLNLDLLRLLGAQAANQVPILGTLAGRSGTTGANIPFVAPSYRFEGPYAQPHQDLEQRLAAYFLGYNQRPFDYNVNTVHVVQTWRNTLLKNWHQEAKTQAVNP